MEIWSKYVGHLRGHNSALMTWIKMPVLYAHVQCMSVLWCSFSNPCMKYCWKSYEETNSSTKCDGCSYRQSYMPLPTSWRGHETLYKQNLLTIWRVFKLDRTQTAVGVGISYEFIPLSHLHRYEKWTKERRVFRIYDHEIKTRHAFSLILNTITAKRKFDTSIS